MEKTLPDGIHILILFIMGTGVGAAFQPSMVAVQANCKMKSRCYIYKKRIKIIRWYRGYCYWIHYC